MERWNNGKMETARQENILARLFPSFLLSIIPLLQENHPMTADDATAAQTRDVAAGGQPRGIEGHLMHAAGLRALDERADNTACSVKNFQP